MEEINKLDGHDFDYFNEGLYEDKEDFENPHPTPTSFNMWVLTSTINELVEAVNHLIQDKNNKMKELDLTDKELEIAMKAAYDENPNVDFFDVGFKKGFLFAKKMIISATNKSSDKKCTTCKYLFSSDPDKPCHECVGFNLHEPLSR